MSPALLTNNQVHFIRLTKTEDGVRKSDNNGLERNGTFLADTTCLYVFSNFFKHTENNMIKLDVNLKSLPEMWYVQRGLLFGYLYTTRYQIAFCYIQR